MDKGKWALVRLFPGRASWRARSVLTGGFRPSGRYVLCLTLAHVVLILYGYALQADTGIVAQTLSVVTDYPRMIEAAVGTLLLLLVGFVSSGAVRRARCARALIAERPDNCLRRRLESAARRVRCQGRPRSATWERH